MVVLTALVLVLLAVEDAQVIVLVAALVVMLLVQEDALVDAPVDVLADVKLLAQA